MKNIKIAFFDVDGTMIDMQKKAMSEKMVETLHRLQEKNIIICVATGRTPVSLPDFQGVDFDVLLTFNGSYCFNKKETIFSNSISQKDVQTILANAKSMNRAVSIATKEKLAANGKDADLVEYYAIANLELEVTDDFDEAALPPFWW